MRASINKSVRGLTPWALALIAVVLTLNPAVARQPEKAAIIEPQVNAAQEAWCKGLLKIGEVYRQKGDYKKVASQFIDDLYDYKEGRVFFKPTLTFGEHTFRPTKEGALSYFVKGIVPTDDGFAIKTHWVKATYDNRAGGPGHSGIQIHGNIAITMGNVYLTDDKGGVTTVDKTFVFRKGSDGKLRLIVHHSSLPYQPGK
ncbi:MAG: hypothetical protein WAM82_24450 [Thermoanaerobaculia bacterium]